MAWVGATMSLLDKLLAKTNPGQSTQRRVLAARVLLTPAGCRRFSSSGAAAIPQSTSALAERQNGRYPPNGLGSKTSRRGHDVAWTMEQGFGHAPGTKSR